MRDNKYEAIITAAAHLVSRKGYKGTSIQEIADKVGIHKSTLFHYFKNKEELLLRIMGKSVDEVTANLKQITTNNELRPEEKLEMAMDNHLTSLIKYFDNVNTYLNESQSLPPKKRAIYIVKRKKYEDDFQKIVNDMQRVGYFKGLDTKIVTFGILGMLNWVAKWFRGSGSFSIKEVSDIFYKMISEK